jgi:transglutaminase-like putative cysteine protease
MKRNTRLAKTMAQDKGYRQIQFFTDQLTDMFIFVLQIQHMKSKSLFLAVTIAGLLLIAPQLLTAQGNGFEYGKITYMELDMKTYERDTSAVAVVLNEFGEASFDLEDLSKVVFQYHVKIKILKESGKKYADFEIPMRKNGTKQEVVKFVKGSSFNRNGNAWKESALLPKSIFTEAVNDYYSLTKFAIPDVQVGSVIEMSYVLETPFVYNFIPWEFQSDIPKVKSEFWAKYPAYYEYGITLKGFLNLTKNEGTVVKECVASGVTAYGVGQSADCSLFKYSIENIPAFKEEDYMTAKKNFLSAITFELSKITQRNGVVDKITSEWKDVEQELKQHESFGAQIKKARNIFEGKVKELKLSHSDPLALAREIHNYFKNDYDWNGDLGKYTDNGIKKLVETKKGNVGDLNLSLLGALQEAGFEAEPVLLSTRANGQPIRHYPVMSDFNYVLVRVKVADKFYFLDATSSLNSFGYVPERCLNGQGRALGETSDWIDIKPADKERVVTDLKIKLNSEGTASGTAIINHYGYAAYNIRNYYYGASSKEEFIQKRTSRWQGLEVKNFMVENEQDLTKPFVEKFDFTLEDQPGNASMLYFQAFLLSRLEKNPFLSNERLYPVDFGAPVENVYLLNFEFPDDYEVEDLPQNVASAMPNAGGRFLFSANKYAGKMVLSSTLLLTKSVYTSDEYHALKELYSRYIATQQSQIVLKKVK